MKTRHVRISKIDTELFPLQITTSDGKEYLIRETVIYYEEEDGSIYAKDLYMIADIEKHLGYGKHGWQQFKDRSHTVEINNKKFSDCETILSALKGCLVETKRKQRVVPNKFFSYELEQVLECFLMEQKRCNIISLEETRNALSRVDTPKAVFKKQNVDAIDEVDKAKEANGNQIAEFMDTVHPGNDIADTFNNVFDSRRVCMSKRKHYDHEFKVQAVKLALEIGQTKACNELKLPENTIYGWMHAYRQGRLDLGPGTQTPARALTMNEELIELRKQVKEQAKEIRRLKEENEFLEEASAFFAASRRKSAKT